MTAWDTESDAREFFEAYAKRTALRYPDAKEKAAAQPGMDVREWQTSEGTVTVALRGKRVGILEGVPPGANLKGLRDSIWH